MEYFDYTQDWDPEFNEFDVEDFLEESQRRERERLEEQLGEIDQQLEERERMHQDHLEELEGKLEWYITRLEQHYKRHTGKQGERQRLKQTIETLYESIREERRSNWLDQQDLQEERRELHRQLDELDGGVLDLL